MISSALHLHKLFSIGKKVILKKISVAKLFGVFDHEIPLSDSGITIVIGENGLGKTIILEATNAFFGRNYGFFRDLEFQKFIFSFDNDELWEITKIKNENKSFLMLGRLGTGKDVRGKPVKIAEMEMKEGSRNSRRREFELLRHHDLMRYEAAVLEGRRTVSLQNWEELERSRYLYDHYRQGLIFEPTEISQPKWFVEASNQISVKLIETQRLITAKERGGESYINTVSKSSKELTENISNIEKAASAISTDLDSTYPNRLVKKLKLNTVEPFEELNDALSKLDALRKHLSSVGLIEGTHDSDFLQISGDQRDLVSALKLYIEDSHKKLAPYEDIAKKNRTVYGNCQYQIQTQNYRD